jgi:hypothetical protein
MKKIAIATYQYNNYGTKLQNYALKRAVDSIGFDTSSIAIRFRKDTFRIFAKLVLKTSPLFILAKYNKFSRFDRQYLKQVHVSYKGLGRLDGNFDYFVAGSDQIWNPSHLSTRVHDKVLFFLSFADNKKKIAYAPSFGVESLTDEQKAMYREQLDVFPYLSARESSGVEIIKELTNRDVDIVPDPTFLLDKNDWNSITGEFDKRYTKKKYAAVYYLSNQPRENRLRIERYANDNNLDVITISGDLHTKGALVPGPAEFVSIIKNAEVVFTDSFHACVFSTINETPFVVRQRTDVSQFTRIENLLEKYSLRDAVDTDGDIDRIVSLLDFTRSVEEIDTQRSKGLDYLRKALHDD